MKTKNPYRLAVFLSAALLFSSAPELWAAARDGAKGPGSGVPVVLPRLPETVTVPGVPVLAAPDLGAGLPAGQAPAAPLPAAQAPAAPLGPQAAAAPQGPVEKTAAAVAPDLEAAAAPETSAPEAAAAGSRIAAAVTGESLIPAAVDATEAGVPPADVFKTFTPAQKKAFAGRYIAHLLRRDGTPDMAARRFSIREPFFQELEAKPVRRQGPAVVDQRVFSRNETRHKPEAGLDAATLWALAVAKSNRSERDGVEYALKKIDPKTRTRDNPLSYIEIEEFYHTRILKDALEVVGLQMRMLPPHPVTAMMVRMMVHFPRAFANVLILCAEVVGVAAFRLLAEKAGELFKDQPESSARIQALFQQILVDEVGHVHYVRSQLGPVRLWLAKRILPLFTRYFLSDIPELNLLFGKKRLLAEIMKADVDGAAAPYPDRFVPFPAPAK